METREYTALPPEYSQPAPEFAPPADEFGGKSGPQPEKKKRKHKKWLYSIAVLFVAAISVGFWGSSASAQESFPVSPRAEGDPEVTIHRAIIQRAASSGYSMVEYKFSLDNHETEYPVYLFFQVTDVNGKQTELSPSPAHIYEDIDGERDWIETTGLDTFGPLTLTIYAGHDTEDGIKWTATSKLVEEEQLPDITFNVDKAVYVPTGNGEPAHVEYIWTLKTKDESLYPFTVYGFVQDGDNYVHEDSNSPFTVDGSESGFSSSVPVGGMQGDLSVRMNATFHWEEADTDITIFAESPVDMSAKTDEPTTYPLGTGNLVITVYNNTFDMSAQDDPDFPYLKILLHTTIPEAEFGGLTLPEPYDVPGDDFDAVGYVLHYNSEFDYGYDPSRDDLAFARRQGSLLLKEDVELVPPADDGNRYINIHVLWKSNSDQIPKMEVILDLGDGDDWLYEGDQPFASEGYFYLAQVPDPEREGYTFTGWYDSEGNKVEYISYYDFFPLLPNAQSREDRDWNTIESVILHAGWKKN